MEKAVALLGPITGLWYDDARFGWRADFAQALSQLGRSDIKVLSPMRNEGELSTRLDPIDNEPPLHPPRAITKRNELDIIRAQVVVFGLHVGDKASIGSLVELGYAKALGKTIVAIHNGKSVYNHPYVDDYVDFFVKTVADAAKVVADLYSDGV